jgi:hypothetical protein
MPKFPKSSGFSQGGNPFTMNQGSKELHTEGSFSKKSSDKMDSYGSPLFAIAQGARSTGLYSDADPSQGRDGIEGAISSGLDQEDGLEVAEKNVAKEDEKGPDMSGLKESSAVANESLNKPPEMIKVGLDDDTITTP